MTTLHIYLFGRFDLGSPGQPVPALPSRRARELLSYLVLHRNHPQRREFLANRLWDDAAPAQGGKLLRQALWQLQTALRPLSKHDGLHLLEVDPEWVQLNSANALQADVIGFEDAARSCHGISGARLDQAERDRLEHAVVLCRGELLEGWYQDWCLVERERLQNDLLDVLEKLVCACEARFENERGLLHARRILAIDPAREQVHRHVMRLHQQGGNRTGALRAFQHCRQVLHEELGVDPSAQTLALHQAIRDGSPIAPEPLVEAGASMPPRPDLAALLAHAQALFADIETRLRDSLGPPERPADKPD